MKFNIFFTLKGVNTGNTIDAPNETNPVECESLKELLHVLAENLPYIPGQLETIGVRVETVTE